MDKNHFQTLRKIDVGAHIEKKNNLSYLSWAYAVDTLLQLDGAATWTYSDPMAYGATLMVFCSVHAFGKTMTAQLPVMDHRNKAIPNPDAMQVNTAMQRCLAKAIALHGIGLYIYAGEDLPEQDKPAAEKPEPTVEKINLKPAPKSAKTITRDVFDELDAETQDYLRSESMHVKSYLFKDQAGEALDYIDSLELDADLKAGMWSLFDSTQRTAMTTVSKTRKVAA